MKKKILLVEDHKLTANLFINLIEFIGGCEVFWASTCDDALKIGEENKDIALVFMDGSLDERKCLDTEDLTRQVKLLCPNAIMIATSSNPGWNDQLVQAGCHEGLLKTEAFDFNRLKKTIQTLNQTPTPGRV